MEPLKTDHFSFAEFELVGAKRILLKDGKPVALNSKSFDLLLALVQRRGDIVTKEDLLESVWPGQFVEEGNLAVQVSALRKIFGERKDEHRFIVTVPGRGYSFVAEIENGDEIIVESHSLSRIVIEEGETNGHRPNQPQETSTGSNRSAKKFKLAAGSIVIAALGTFGFWIYQRNQAHQTFAKLWIEPSKASKPIQLTTNGKVGFAALSPDGEHFAYTIGQTERPSLWYAHTNGKQQVQIRAAEPGTFHGLTFAPDGAEIYYSAEGEKTPEGALFRIPVLGGTPQKVLANIQSPVAFSPDGKQLAFVRNAPKRKLSLLVIADADNGANERVVAARSAEERFSLRGASWSPDGKFIAVGVVSGTVLPDEEVALVNVETGSVEKFGTQPFQAVRRVAWLKDGSGIFVNAIEKDVWDERHLWLIEYPSGIVNRITQDLFHYGMFNLSVSDNGERVLSVSSTKICSIFVSPASDLAQASKISATSLGKLPGAEGMAWTPDGKIAYSAFFDKDQSLWIMNADGSNPRQLKSPGFLDRFPSASADTVVFGSSRVTGGNSAIWRTDIETGELKQLAVGNRPSLTPDGRWVLYGSPTDDGFVSVYTDLCLYIRYPLMAAIRCV